MTKTSMAVLKRLILLFIILGITLPNSSSAASPIPPIKVLGSNWGDASVQEIHQVLTSTAKQIFPFTKKENWSPIIVKRSIKGPIVLFKKGKNGEYIVYLNTQDRYWCQYAFQFAHEIGHIICGHHEENKRHLWFEETICEVASLFALFKLSEDWSESPPYPHLSSYANEFKKYATTRMQRRNTPKKFQLSSWYRQKKIFLQSNPTDFDRNLDIAKSLLPIFENNPSLWQACKYLRFDQQNQYSFREYLQKWQARCQLPKNQDSIEEIKNLFGIQ